MISRPKSHFLDNTKLSNPYLELKTFVSNCNENLEITLIQTYLLNNFASYICREKYDIQDRRAKREKKYSIVFLYQITSSLLSAKITIRFWDK